MQERELLPTVDGKGNWCSIYGKQLLHDLAIPVLDIHPEKILIQKDTCTPMSTAALFATAKTWKQPKYSLTDD